MTRIAASTVESLFTPRRVDVGRTIRHQDRRVLRHDAVVQTTQVETTYSANESPHFSKPLGIALSCRLASHERIGLRSQNMEGVERALELLGERLQALVIGRTLIIAGIGHVMRILLVAGPLIGFAQLLTTMP